MPDQTNIQTKADDNNATSASSEGRQGEGGSNLLDILERNNAIDKAQREEIIKEAHKLNLPLEQIVKDKKIVGENALAKAMGELSGTPFIDLQTKSIYPDVLRLIPQEVAVSFRMIAFDREDDTLKVAMIDPQDYKALESLEFAIGRQGLKTEIYITTLSSLQHGLQQYEKSLKEEVSKALEEVEPKKIEEAGSLEDIKEIELRRLVEAAPISKMVQVIIKHAVDGRASDIHIEPESDLVQVRYRVDGVLHKTLTLPGKLKDGIVSRIKIMSNLKIDETRIPQDGRIRMKFKDRPYDFRVSTLPVVNGEKVVLRILKSGAAVLSLEELGITGLRLKNLKKEIKKSHGMLLVTGPTGSGKSTTLYSVIGILNKEDVNIITLEDPVEYFVNGISQSQVNPEVGLTFASGLRSILRQDPDIIMVGEVRDEETAEMAIHAALTGHVVLSTLHTNDAIGAVPRLIDMGIQPFLITSAVNMVIGQRLVRRICQRCKEEIKAPPEVKKSILEEWVNIPDFEKENINFNPDDIRIFKGKGCKHCKEEGYQGRIGIYEAIPIDEGLQELILSKPSEAQINKFVKEKGYINMKQDGILKVLRGDTTIEEVFRVTRI
jgi:type IV pilus assembly protein PilB